MPSADCYGRGFGTYADLDGAASTDVVPVPEGAVYVCVFNQSDSPVRLFWSESEYPDIAAAPLQHWAQINPQSHTRPVIVPIGARSLVWATVGVAAGNSRLWVGWSPS